MKPATYEMWWIMIIHFSAEKKNCTEISELTTALECRVRFRLWRICSLDCNVLIDLHWPLKVNIAAWDHFDITAISWHVVNMHKPVASGHTRPWVSLMACTKTLMFWSTRQCVSRGARLFCLRQSWRYLYTPVRKKRQDSSSFSCSQRAATLNTEICCVVPHFCGSSRPGISRRHCGDKCHYF